MEAGALNGAKERSFVFLDRCFVPSRGICSKEADTVWMFWVSVPVRTQQVIIPASLPEEGSLLRWGTFPENAVTSSVYNITE